MPLSLFVGDRDLTPVAEGLTFSTVDPGGYETLSFNVPSLDYLPTIGDRVRLFEGLEPCWEGRVEEAAQDYAGPRATGRVSCVGAGAALKDAEYSMIYVDRDLSRWGDISVQRRIDLLTGSQAPKVQRDEASGAPSVVTGIHGAWTNANRPISEAVYDAGPRNRIGRFYYAWRRGGYIDHGDANWTWRVGTADGDDFSGATVGSNLRAAGPGSGTFTPTTPQRYAFLQLFYAAVSGGGDNADYIIIWSDLAVFGDHGLTARGTAPNQGFYTSDIVRHALDQATGIDPGVIEDDTGLIITQAAYYDPVTPERVIDDMARRSGFHWGVWSAPGMDGNPRLHFTAPPEQATAIITRADADSFQPSQRLSGLYDTVNVRYQDAANGPGIVTVTRPNPFLPEQLAGRQRTVDFGIGSEAAAQVYGETLLALWEQQARAAGPLTLPGNIQLPGGGTKPAHLLKAGIDRLQITDLPNAGPWTETDTRRFDTFRIRRTESRVERGGRVVTSVELDAGADLVEVLNARLQDAVGIVD